VRDIIRRKPKEINQDRMMTVLYRRAWAALPLALPLMVLAGCAENPAEPVRGLAELTRFATPPTAMPDFVQASRPAEKGAYLPVGVDAPARTVKPKTAAGSDATRKELEEAAKANQSQAGAKSKP
jgi:hypothetical protein